MLREVAASREGAIKARALYSLSTHASGKEKRELEEKVIALIPDSAFTTRILYNRGWDRWNSGDIKGAVQEWEKSISSGMDGNWRPRVLYWVAHGYELLKSPEKKAAFLEKIRKNHPLSIYAFLSGGDKLSIVPDVPRPLAQDSPSDLEQWGFITYARWHLLARGDAKSLFRAARLAEWSGDHLAAYSAVGRIAGEITRGPSFFRKGMEYLYPRPFLDEVRKAAERFKVEENLVWAIMRQESAFNPNATSWVGAAGLMQLMPATARSEAKALEMKNYNLYNAGQNIILGTAHIARLLKSFSNVEQAVAAYNERSGSARRWLAGRKDVPLDEWIESVRFEETNDYVRKVMANLHIYRALYGIPRTEGAAPERPATCLTTTLKLPPTVPTLRTGTTKLLFFWTTEENKVKGAPPGKSGAPFAFLLAAFVLPADCRQLFEFLQGGFEMVPLHEELPVSSRFQVVSHGEHGRFPADEGDVASRSAVGKPGQGSDADLGRQWFFPQVYFKDFLPGLGIRAGSSRIRSNRPPERREGSTRSRRLSSPGSLPP